MMKPTPVPVDEEWLHTGIMRHWIEDARKWLGTYETSYGLTPPPTDTGAVSWVCYNVLQGELHSLREYADPEFQNIVETFRRISKLTWSQLIADEALEWRAVQSIPDLNSLRLTSASRAVCKRNKDRLYFLVLDAPYSTERIALHDQRMERLSN